VRVEVEPLRCGMDNNCLANGCPNRFIADVPSGWAFINVFVAESRVEGLLCPIHAYCLGSLLGGSDAVVPQSQGDEADRLERSREIMIVDDDPAIRESLCETLENEGYVVHVAANGNEALAKLQSSPSVSLILLDLTMPVMDGWAFLHEQQRRPELFSVPVLVITAGSAIKDEDEESQIDAAGLLRKPLDIPQLLRSVQRLC
jgi:CheY-like chemotaxis protein